MIFVRSPAIEKSGPIAAATTPSMVPPIDVSMNG